jgi:signal peptidase II
VARALAPLYLTAGLVILLDQLSKAYVVGLLGMREGAYKPILGDLLWLRMVHNSGAAFGMLPNASVLFAVAAVAVALAIVLSSRRLADGSRVVRVALGMELGGAIGNLIDRARYGYVVDFVDVRLWPFVFNVADASITLGVVLLAGHILLAREAPKDAAVPGERHAGDHLA